MVENGLWCRSDTGYVCAEVGGNMIVCMCSVGGKVREEDGAWCRSDTIWKDCLEKLYDHVVSEYEAGCSRLRRGSR